VRITRRVAALIAIVTLVACTGDGPDGSQATDDGGPSAAAPDFPEGLDWLNTSQPVSLSDLQGKVVVPFFWTSSCLSCAQVLPELERLQSEYSDELVIIGVHSPKYEYEADTEAVRRVLLRYGIEHPVVNDHDFRIWREWGVQAWPTAVLVDPTSSVAGVHAGGDLYGALKPAIDDLVEEYRPALDPSARVFPAAFDELAPTVLSFPGKVLADDDGGRLFIADTNHNRVVVAGLESGEVLMVIGSGAVGSADGVFESASFNQPLGMALDATGSVLYVADSANHLIRAVDLTAPTVTTVAGTGERGAFPLEGGPALETALDAPFDLVLDGGRMYVAMAGSNQLWQWDLAEGFLGPLAGTGREGAANGPGPEAELAQPAALALDAGGRLYFADAASNAVRWIDIQAGPQVGVLAGGDTGLFDFGDLDGTGTAARLQYPLGLALDREDLWVTDTYNSKIKHIDPATGEVVTVAGSEAGWRDGLDPLFAAPEGVDAAGGRLYVADTGNHSVRVVDPDSGETTTMILKGIERLVPDDEEFEGTEVVLDPIEVGPGPGRVVLTVAYPPGFKANEEAPSRFEWNAAGGVVALAPTANVSIAGPTFPVEIDATFAEGEGALRADLWLVYCAVDSQSICLFDRARIEAPLRVTTGAPTEVHVGYEVVLPEGI
jgi:DNA-binding beta-propeller fold protein YncE